MPRSNTNQDAGSTTSIPAENLSNEVERPDPAMFDELMQGLPEEQKNIKLDRIAGDDPAAPKPPGLREAPAGKVVLLNLKFENEKFCVPEPDEDGKPRFVGQRILEFVDGYLICSRDQADFVKERAPHVYEEPGPDSGLEILTFPQTGFKTRISAALSEHATRWADNQ